MTVVDPIPCAHIYAYYQARWEAHKCIAFNLLRRGYYECSIGRLSSENNLYK